MDEQNTQGTTSEEQPKPPEAPAESQDSPPETPQEGSQGDGEETPQEPGDGAEGDGEGSEEEGGGEPEDAPEAEHKEKLVFNRPTADVPTPNEIIAPVSLEQSGPSKLAVDQHKRIHTPIGKRASRRGPKEPTPGEHIEA
jgi:hypothetical protein